MKSPIIVTLLLLLSGAVALSKTGTSFRDEQSKYPRVRTAFQEKDAVLRQKFAAKHLAYPPKAILLRAFKKEGQLELWANDTEKTPYTLVETYSICATSGSLGPKRQLGDMQVPEGFYQLDWFNPQSNFYLSLHISYPNAADRILGSRQNPGGDIFLHGNCASIGCIPITDDGIKEVYWLAVLTKAAGARELPIEIFPGRLTDKEYRALAMDHRSQPELLGFWNNLKTGFDLFEKTHRPPQIKVAGDGTYEFVTQIDSSSGQ
jgi:murein L,D-transpeptidase YafK